MSVTGFLNGSHKDNSGRSLEVILSQTDEWLESDHSYIQWLFPLIEESQNVHDAPVLTEVEIEQIRNDQVALRNQQRALSRMVQFYLSNDHWLVRMDHNHLRITRMLKSVRLLQSLELAEAIYNLLMEQVHTAGAPILPRNLTFWTDAVGLSYSQQNKCQ